MKRRISICIDELQAKYGDREALAMAKRMGADSVDFSLLYYDKGLYLRGETAVEEEMRSLRAHAASLGLSIGQTHGRIVGFKNDAAHDAAVLSAARLDCLATAALGAPYCVMHTVSTIHMGADADPALMRRINDEMFLGVLPFAREYGIKIATETFGDATGLGVCDFFGNLDELIAGYDRICAKEPSLAPHFCVCMDTGHTNKAVRFPGQPTVGEAIRRLGSRLQVLHLNDNDGLTDQHKIPMTGTVDWRDTLSALDEIGYAGNYNMELLLTHFGKNFEYEEAAFAVKVLHHMLSERYGEEA